MSDEFDIYGDADTGDVADAQGDSAPNVDEETNPNASQTDAVGDGAPGVPVDGYPGLRAGVPGGDGALGLYRDPGQPHGDQGAVPVFQTASWRDTDPEATNYDLYQKKRQLRDAQTIGDILTFGGGGQTGAAAAAKQATARGLSGLAESIGALAEPYTGHHGFGLGLYMDKVEKPRLQNEVQDLQARQKQFGRSTS